MPVPIPVAQVRPLRPVLAALPQHPVPRPVPPPAAGMGPARAHIRAVLPFPVSPDCVEGVWDVRLNVNGQDIYILQVMGRLETYGRDGLETVIRACNAAGEIVSQWVTCIWNHHQRLMLEKNGYQAMINPTNEDRCRLAALDELLLASLHELDRAEVCIRHTIMVHCAACRRMRAMDGLPGRGLLLQEPMALPEDLFPMAPGPPQVVWPADEFAQP